MLSLEQIEQDLTAAMKSRESVAVQTLRALKTRVQNEKVSKLSRGAGAGGELSEDEIAALIKSEIKRRKESAEAFAAGGREEQAAQERAEASVLERYLPAQLSEAQVGAIVEEVLAAHSFTAQDFGKAMAAVKARAGTAADGAVIAKLLKEKLK